MAPQPSANAGLKLTLGSQKSSPAPPAQSFANAHRTNGNSAAADQKLTNGQPNGVNLAGTGAGQAPSRVSMAPPAYPVNGVTGPTQGTSVGVKSASPLPALQPNGVPGTSRLSGLVNGASAAALSAGNTSRLSSGSPLPGQAPPALQPYIAYPQYAISGFDSKWRQEGRGKPRTKAYATPVCFFFFPSLVIRHASFGASFNIPIFTRNWWLMRNRSALLQPSRHNTARHLPS